MKLHTHTYKHMNYIHSLDPMRTNKVLTKAEATEWKKKIEKRYKVSKQGKGVKKIH